jgi:hypothetical protein
MPITKSTVKSFWEEFNKFVGVQGIMGLGLVGGFIYASIAQVTLPENYTNIMTLVVGYYFAKNGVGIVAAIRGVK